MNIKEITCFQSSDNSIHRTLELAEKHEIYLENQRKSRMERKLQIQDFQTQRNRDFETFSKLKVELLEIAEIQRKLKKTVYDAQLKYTKKPTNTRLKKVKKILRNIEENKQNIWKLARLKREIKSKYSFYSWQKLSQNRLKVLN